jgi:metal-sulfur cluster biosynthetic enzyme
VPTKEETMEAVSKLVRPEIDHTLAEMGTVTEAGVEVEGETTRVILSVPFEGIPVKDLLVKMVEEAVAGKDPDARVEVAFSTMSEVQREEFARKARQRWKS